MTAGPNFRMIGRRRLGLVRSAEAAECGLACMAMVARFHGHRLEMNDLRQRFPVSMAGATLRGLMSIGDDLGFSARAVRVDLGDLRDLRTPAILHWDFNHFVVLESAGPNAAVVYDPGRGMLRLSMAELSGHFTGIALELTPSADFRVLEGAGRPRLGDLWSRMTGFWPAALKVLGLSFALQVLTFALPFQLQLAIDEGILRADFDLLSLLAGAFALLIVLHAAIDALRSWLLQVFGQMLSFQLVGNVVRHLIRLPTDWFEKRNVGDILSRVASATAIQEILTKGVVAALIDGLMAIAAIVILVLYSAPLAAVVVSAVALNAVVAIMIFPSLRSRNETQIVERAREQAQLMETIRAATTIKVMGREAEREGVWRNLFAGSITASISVGKFQIALTTLQGLITGLQTVVVIYLGASAILRGDGFSIGMLVAFLSFRQTFTDRTNSLINQVIQFRFIGLHLERLADIVGSSRDHAEDGPVAHLDVRGALALHDVGFSYGVSDRKLFEGLNLTVQAGEFLAITGASGGGKTTLLKIILGLRQPTEGRIELDGVAASPSVWRAWREHVGLVAQDDRLLSGTIAENISFFDPEIDMARVHQAARDAQVHADIVRMPMQYLSLVGDMGSSLSGGQKQRLLLARALYRRPKILILDEGTANLDVETEEVIAEVIRSMKITRIVVAHRPALLERADRVLKLADGALVHARRPAASKVDTMVEEPA